MKRPIGAKGQVVIPKDIREYLKLKKGENLIFEMKNKEISIKKEQNTKDFLKDFFSIARTKKQDLKLEDIRRIEDESYDLH